jgi:hypothetical protein
MIECVTRSVKGKFSVGLDEIAEYLVKQCIQHIQKPLAHIYNASCKSGIFPDMLKTAIVKSLYKKEAVHNVQHYRPVSVLPVFKKILEKLMYHRLISFVPPKKTIH